MPVEVESVFDAAADSLLRNLSPLLAVPEFKVPLPGGSRASQNDIFVLAKSDAGPVVIMVEGKASESFGPSLNTWQAKSSRGKSKRITFLLEKVGWNTKPEGTTRYQLIHRAASAIITAEQFRAVAAVLLVHSFSENRAGWSDYDSFLKQIGVEAQVSTVQRIPLESAVPLFAVWVAGDCSYLKS